MDLVIDALTPAAAGVLALTLVPADGRELPPWRPGAHIDVTLPQGPTRQYSLCGDPADRSSWRIAVRREEDSRGGSAWFHDQATEGMTLMAGTPRNLFELRPAKAYVFVAGGIGITPLLPMIAEAEQAGTPWTLWYAGRTRSSMAFVDELARYGDRVHLAASDAGDRIRVADVLGSLDRDVAVYCCGPHSLTAAVEDACEPGSVHVERFAAGTVPADGGFDVHCALSGVDVRVEDGTTVLDALLEAGVEADYSCTQGFCGICETRVLEGVPDHRDDYLDHSAAPDTMMICVSRSRCPKLVLDI